MFYVGAERPDLTNQISERAARREHARGMEDVNLKRGSMAPVLKGQTLADASLTWAAYRKEHRLDGEGKLSCAKPCSSILFPRSALDRTISGSGVHTSSALALFPQREPLRKNLPSVRVCRDSCFHVMLEKVALALVRDMHGPFEEMQLYGGWLALPVTERRLWTATSASERAQQ